MADEAAFARLGASVLSYFASLPPKRQLLILLTLKGAEGFPAEQLLAAEDDPQALFAAAEELASEGKLVRREHPDGRFFWARPDGDSIYDTEGAVKGGSSARRRPDGANDDGPDEGERAM